MSKKLKYGDPVQKESQMTLANSKHFPRPKEPLWREVTISEAHLRDALAPVLKQFRLVISTSDVDRVILSEPDKGTYRLTYSISRGKEA